MAEDAADTREVSADKLVNDLNEGLSSPTHVELIKKDAFVD